jgi:hypothetical protein
MSLVAFLRAADKWGPSLAPWLIALVSACFAGGVWWNTQSSDKNVINDRLASHESTINEMKLEMKAQRTYIDTRLNDISRDIQSGNREIAKMSGQLEIILRRQGVTP